MTEFLEGLRFVLVAAVLLGSASRFPRLPERGAERRLGLEWRMSDDTLFHSRLAIVNDDTEPLGAADWTLYFNFGGRIVTETLPSFVRIAHVNGDLYRLDPATGFRALAPGLTLEIPIETRDPIVTRSDEPSGFYFVFARQAVVPAVVHEAVRPPVVAPSDRYAHDADLVPLPPEDVGLITPAPRRLVRGLGDWRLTRGACIRFGPGLAGEAAYLAQDLEARLGYRLAVVSKAEPGGASAIVLEIDSAAPAESDEGYRLSVDPHRGVVVQGHGRAGVFYGIQSLRALLRSEDGGEPRVPVVSIEDAPRFRYRGLMLDVARNFQPKASVIKLLELMSFYKLNTLHLHLSDDEGWRIEIASLPELTEVGGRRGHTTDERDHLLPSFGSGPDASPAPGSGHYTRRDFVDILRYARRRHIAVVPEIDMPGHSRAAVVAMRAREARLRGAGRLRDAEKYRLHDPDDRSVYRSVQGWNDGVMNVCQPSTYAFVRTVIGEMADLYKEARAPLTAFHIGGDEVPPGTWERSPECARLRVTPGREESPPADLASEFVGEVARIAGARGLVVAGWEEIARARSLPPQSRVYVWNSVSGVGVDDSGLRLAAAGYDVVVSRAANLYFDLAYERDGAERGQHWAGFVDTRTVWDLSPFGTRALDEAARRHVLGVQGQLWGEDVPDSESMEYLLFPKLLALAERAWTPEPGWEATAADGVEPEARRRAAWNEFAHRLGLRELPRLDTLAGGVHYRVPPPGAVVEHGVLRASVAYPGLEVRYTTDGRDPDETAALYVGPVTVRGTVRLKTFTRTGRTSRTSVSGAGAEVLQ